VVFAIAFGLSAIAVIPAAELTQYTARTQLTYAGAAEYSLPLAGLAGLFSPLIFGRGPADFWGPWARVELGYMGLLPLLLAGLAPFRLRRGVPLFMILLAAFGLLVALGENTPFHFWLYRLVPGFAQLRVPARFLLLTNFALAALAGLGLHAALSLTGRRLWLWGVALGIMALLVMTLGYGWAERAAGEHRERLLIGASLSLGLLAVGCGLLALRARLGLWLPVLAVVVQSIDVIGHGANVEVEWNDPMRGFQHPAAVAFLRGQPGPTRIDNASSAWAPDSAALHGLEDVNGLFNPLGLAAYQTYLGAVGPRGAPRYNFLNAQFIIADKDRPPADNPAIVPVFNEDPAVDIYLNTAALPRVSLAVSATIVPDSQAAFGALFAPGFDPATGVIIEGAALPASPPAPAEGESNMYYLRYTPEDIAVVARTPTPAYLVFSEVWYPGWRATVNGRDVPLHRANFAFRAVALTEPGEHVVELRFDPLSWKVGLGITALTLGACIVWLASSKLRRPRA
jgi:hypothetical protein